MKLVLFICVLALPRGSLAQIWMLSDPATSAEAVPGNLGDENGFNYNYHFPQN